MALGKPVVTFLHDEAVARTEQAFGTRRSHRNAASRHPRPTRLRPLVEDAGDRRRVGQSAAPTPSASTHRPGRRPPARHLRSALSIGARLAGQAARQAHAVYGARWARLTHPRGTPPAAVHALPRADRLREDRDRRRADDRARDRSPPRHLERVLPLLLRHEGRSAADARRPHLVLVHDGDGDGGADRRLHPRRADRPRAEARRRPWLVRAAFVGLWAQMNYEQLTVALPGRGALDPVRARQPRERADHGRRDRAARRRPAQGRRPARSSATSSGRSASTSSCSPTAATSSGSSSRAASSGR